MCWDNKCKWGQSRHMATELAAWPSGFSPRVSRVSLSPKTQPDHVHYLLNIPHCLSSELASKPSLWLQRLSANLFFKIWPGAHCLFPKTLMGRPPQIFTRFISPLWLPSVFPSSLTAFPCSPLHSDCLWAGQLLHIHVFSKAQSVSCLTLGISITWGKWQILGECSANELNQVSLAWNN